MPQHYCSMPKRPYSNAGACHDVQHTSDASVAKDQISQAGYVYVPRGTQSVDTFVDAAINDFYQNENTLDGKTNTHSMAAVAAVLYQRWGTLNDDKNISRSMKKALHVTEYTEVPLYRHAKPQQMPEPPPMLAASLL